MEEPGEDIGNPSFTLPSDLMCQKWVLLPLYHKRNQKGENDIVDLDMLHHNHVNRTGLLLATKGYGGFSMDY